MNPWPLPNTWRLLANVSEILTCNGTQNHKCRIILNTTVLKYEKKIQRD